MRQFKIPTHVKTYGATQCLEQRGVLRREIFRICRIEIICRSQNPSSECKCNQ